MRTPIRKPQPNLRDLARFASEAADRFQEQQILQSQSIRIDWTRNGTALEVPRLDPSSAGGVVEQYWVKAVHRDHLICELAEVDDETGEVSVSGDEVQVAKPFELQVTPWDYDLRVARGVDGAIAGFEYRYEAKGNNVDPTQNPFYARSVTMVDGTDYSAAPSAIKFPQQISPPYVAFDGKFGSLIYAQKVKQDIGVFNESVQIASDPAVVFSEAVNAEWIDLNLAARRFEDNYRKIKICTAPGESKWVLIRTSGAFDTV